LLSPIWATWLMSPGEPKLGGATFWAKPTFDVDKPHAAITRTAKHTAPIAAVRIVHLQVRERAENRAISAF
jgi:hypothetical protein